MSISVLLRNFTVFNIVIVSFLFIFQTSSNINDVLGSSIGISDEISKNSSISLPINYQKEENPKSHFETGMEDINKDNWIFVNHDIYGSRNSNQTQIDKSNVGDLEVKWRLNNTYEIQDPPILVNGTGYFQDYVGNIISFDTMTG